MERLMLVLEAAADPEGSAARLTAGRAPDLYLVNRGEHAETLALVLARKLRAAGMSVDLDGSDATFSKQFKNADGSVAAWQAVIGEQEVEVDQLRIKPLMAEGEERRLALDDLDAVVAILKTTTESHLGVGNER